MIAPEANRKWEAAGPDTGLLGQCVRCRSPAGGCWEQRRGTRACGQTAGTQRTGQPQIKEKYELLN